MTVENRTVVVTGIGAFTPLGGDAATTWENLLAGRSGVAALTEEWAAQLPVRIAARTAVDPGEILPARWPADWTARRSSR